MDQAPGHGPGGLGVDPPLIIYVATHMFTIKIHFIKRNILSICTQRQMHIVATCGARHS
jgi:hypothetical protein